MTAPPAAPTTNPAAQTATAQDLDARFTAQSLSLFNYHNIIVQYFNLESSNRQG